MSNLRILFFVLVLAQHIKLSAQDSIPSGPFVKLFSGEIITGKDINVTGTQQKPRKINLDGKLYDEKKVMYYKDWQLTLFTNVNRFANSFYDTNNFYFYSVMGNSSVLTPEGEYQSRKHYGNQYFSIGLEMPYKLSPKNFLKFVPIDSPGYSSLLKARKMDKYLAISIISCFGGISLFGSIPLTMDSTHPNAYLIRRLGAVTCVIGALSTVVTFKLKGKFFYKGLKEFCDFPI